MVRFLIYSVVLIIFAIVMSNSDPDGGAFAVASGIVIGFAIPLIDTFIVHARFAKFAWYAIRTWNTHVRISASYLYRIKVDNDYLLVKGKRFDQYQPVGGVYKAHPSSSGRRSQLKILDDNLLHPDTVSESDLRIRVPGKHLISFVKWFEEERGRETDGWREFCEELITTGLLPQEVFRVIKYDRLERLYNPMRYSKWAQCQELLIADILELLPTEDQLVELRRLKERSPSEALWASEQQIRRLGAVDGLANQPIRIAETAVWTVDAAI